jgi:transposase-like protein
MFVSYERSEADVEAVSALLDTGLSDREIGRRTGVSRGSVQRWRTRGTPRSDHRHPEPWMPFDPSSYSYLFAIYLE